jgi:hypothetical protein
MNNSDGDGSFVGNGASGRSTIGVEAPREEITIRVCRVLLEPQSGQAAAQEIEWHVLASQSMRPVYVLPAVFAFVACKGSAASCPPKDEVAAVVRAMDTKTSAEEDVKLLYALQASAEKAGAPHVDLSVAPSTSPAKKALVVDAGFKLGERLDALVASKGALAGSDVKMAYMEAAKADGLTEDASKAIYGANAAGINAYLIENVLVGANENQRVVLDRSRKCAEP